MLMKYKTIYSSMQNVRFCFGFMVFRALTPLLAVLRLLCRNPHGIFMAGDTAQQITSTAFRFADLTALLYRLEVGDSSLRGAAAEHENRKQISQ
jgi:hypothetical protein